MEKKQNPTGQKERSRKYDGKKLEWLRTFKFFLFAAVILFLLFRFVIGLSAVSGDSMQNTLFNGDFVLYNRLKFSYERGDVVSVRDPVGDYYVKRVVAVAGDTVDLKDGKLYVNGEVETGDYFLGETIPEVAESHVSYPYTVSDGCVFVLGDNRPGSTDSRLWGERNLREVKGLLFLRFGWFFADLL